MGKLIYQPKGKAREYSPWACNLYNGCSNRCEYCYNRHCPGASLLGADNVTLKSGATLEQFKKELLRYKEQIITDDKGLFFNFVSDPFLEETYELNMQCAEFAFENRVPCVFLSKRKVPIQMADLFMNNRDYVKVGFTLTGCDELEPGANTNQERITEINLLGTAGIKTWASIEPVISIQKSIEVIIKAHNAGCRNFKIGLLSGKKEYSPLQVFSFKESVDISVGADSKVYWKDSVIDYINKPG